MLENDLNEMILSVEQQINLIKIKMKLNKKDLKKLNNMCKDTKYIDTGILPVIHTIIII